MTSKIKMYKIDRYYCRILLRYVIFAYAVEYLFKDPKTCCIFYVAFV